ncbi:MAG: AAA family ATPase, partial [Deltaproteobacteria bacterium]|nr:AAA family ATPase [Deltaproteobacteria bacterium]
MYESFFGFTEEPFRDTADPRFLYLSGQNRETLDRLTYGIRERKGLVILTGEAGTGKTTIIRALLEKLGAAYQIVYVFNPMPSVTGFFKYLLHELGLEAESGSEADYRRRLRRFLSESRLQGKCSVLAIDEAQNLSTALFEEITMLANWEVSGQKLLQVLLVGQPGVNSTIKKADLRLKQSIALRFHLCRLNARETKEYIRTRLRIAQTRNPDCFTDAAIRKIFK